MPRLPWRNYKIHRKIKHLAWIKSLEVNPVDFALHLSSFAAPALAVALLVTSGARLALGRSGAALGWWGSFATNFIAGLVALAAGLGVFGNDGKMATYAALVVSVATCQWMIARGWRR